MLDENWSKVSIIKLKELHIDTMFYNKLYNVMCIVIQLINFLDVYFENWVWEGGGSCTM